MTSLTDSLKECGAIKSGDFTLSSGKKPRNTGQKGRL
ncbi:MAG: hypothetical protein MPEBLZ_01826 [Candidatus Methanoperedens nitroreducens]|uniref:Uncharacterized protein n=1 Tax=Candidatus Methanoperedens nitratireducens TaxID=1392998 RepID=A0A0P8AAJ8_9EURY|nr:MAG: hypothetical protein MPEBLZ_01826 [Candidatus Methanoperedens sp. BLZ1]CAG0966783.1 hypothetical protein METP2_01141 [Methanosarcinales archaeon]